MKKKELQREIEELRRRVSRLEEIENDRRVRNMFNNMKDENPIILRPKTFKECLEDAKDHGADFGEPQRV